MSSAPCCRCTSCRVTRLPWRPCWRSSTRNSVILLQWTAAATASRRATVCGCAWSTRVCARLCTGRCRGPFDNRCTARSPPNGPTSPYRHPCPLARPRPTLRCLCQVQRRCTRLRSALRLSVSTWLRRGWHMLLVPSLQLQLPAVPEMVPRSKPAAGPTPFLPPRPSRQLPQNVRCWCPCCSFAARYGVPEARQREQQPTLALRCGTACQRVTTRLPSCAMPTACLRRLESTARLWR
mmetsp:Transcript_4743/g.15339  ORF Transcript_4743/g.15339 Transcript_4743/m.15339 type:complete len:237 (-) Transcript_4743:211-921(-)